MTKEEKEKEERQFILGTLEKMFDGRLEEQILLAVNPHTDDFLICPTSFVVGREGEVRRTSVTWVSKHPFVIQFIDRTPFKSAQYHSELNEQEAIHLKKVKLPEKKMKAGIFEYAAAICIDGKAFVHVSGEMCMNPGGGGDN